MALSARLGERAMWSSMARNAIATLPSGPWGRQGMSRGPLTNRQRMRSPSRGLPLGPEITSQLASMPSTSRKCQSLLSLIAAGPRRGQPDRWRDGQAPATTGSFKPLFNDVDYRWAVHEQWCGNLKIF
jgi:hypothetical protein